MKALAPLPLILAVAAGACEAPTNQPTARETHAEATLSVRDAWAAPTPAGADVAAGYLTIANATASADRLLSVTSPRAERVEVHEMSMDGAVMRMRAVERLDLPANHDVQLSPGGMHLMFVGVHEPFVEGQTIPVRLEFESTRAIDVNLPVRRGAPPDHGSHG